MGADALDSKFSRRIRASEKDWLDDLFPILDLDLNLDFPKSDLDRSKEKLIWYPERAFLVLILVIHEP